MAEKYNYYREQLDRLNVKDSKYPALLKITNNDNGESKSTNFISLNDESASELVKWLKENYNVSE